MTKPQVELARRQGLALAEARSQEICFVPGFHSVLVIWRERGTALPDTSGEYNDRWRSHRRAPGYSQFHRRTAQGPRSRDGLAARDSDQGRLGRWLSDRASSSIQGRYERAALAVAVKDISAPHAGIC